MSAPTHDITALTGSVQGKPIKVASTGPAGTAGTLLHQVPSGEKHRIELWAWSAATTVVTLTLQIGGTTAPDNELSVTIPPKGSEPTLILPYWQLDGGAAGLPVYGYAGTANMILVAGHANKRVPAA